MMEKLSAVSCSLLHYVSKPETGNMTAVIKEQFLYFSTNLYIYYTDFMHVVLAYLMALCFKMAAAT